MENRYDDVAAQKVVQDLGARGAISELLALRTYTARLLGSEASLVLHGGGNTSVKAEARTLLGEVVRVLHVKGSGWDLATIEPAGHPAVRLAPLLAYRALASMSDEDMVNELRLCLLDAAAPTPSVETLLHAYLPAKFIDHTHADAILALADQPNGEALCREAVARDLVWVPYVMPGFALAQRCADAFDAAVARGENPHVIVLERHGIFTFGDTAKESYGRMIDAVSAAESFIETKRSKSSARVISAPPIDRTEALLPRLRGVLAALSGDPVERGPILELRRTPSIDEFLARPDARELSEIGCATPDHVLRTKPTALFLPEPADDASLSPMLTREVTSFAERYDAYFAACSRARGVARTKLDPWPRVILVPGVGLVTAGKTRKEAKIAADVYEHTIRVMTDASDIGTYSPVGREDLFDVEYWSLEQAKLKKTAQSALAGRVALVTGAASGIGLATSRRLLDLGAHVVLVDRDASELSRIAAELSAGRGAMVVIQTADVTSYSDVERAVSLSVRTFGGLDLVVSNAGTASEGKLETETGESALRSSLDVNLLAHNHVARASVAVMRAQGRGGCLLFNASKSAFAPGPGFGPYAVAKAALVALVRQYAIDLGGDGIRANAVNADRVRTAIFAKGFAESRARARGITVDEYFRANLLHREVTADHVADAFVYLATATATTGALITTDGGNSAAFPR